MAELTVKLVRPPVPTVWLDASVISKMAQVEHGIAAGLSKEDQSRYGKLHAVLSKKVAEGTIVCVEGEQESEFRSCDQSVTEMLSTFHRLSHGKRLQHWFLIEQVQFAAAAKAFLSDTELVEYS